MSIVIYFLCFFCVLIFSELWTGNDRVFNNTVGRSNVSVVCRVVRLSAIRRPRATTSNVEIRLDMAGKTEQNADVT